MKKLITAAQEKFTHWLFKRIDLFRNGQRNRFDLSQTCLVDNTEQSNGIAILDKTMYVAFERRYKVISHKDLKGIVENEKNYHSPFKRSYALYKTTELGEGNWLVHYYFVDLDLHPEVEHYTLILIWEEIVVSLLGSKGKIPLKISSPMGEQVLVTAENSLRVLDVTGSGLKNRVLATEHIEQAESCVVEGLEFSNQITSYVLTFGWAAIHGAFNRERFSRKGHRFAFNPRILALGSGLVVIAILLESAYLVGMGYYLDNKALSTSDLRKEYSDAKGKYLRKLDQYSELAGITASKSNVSDIPALLSKLPANLEFRIDRMDYIEGEVRIGGISGDIESLMTYLSNHPQVEGLDFMSPITPDKKSGKDRFLIRFDFKHG